MRANRDCRQNLATQKHSRQLKFGGKPVTSKTKALKKMFTQRVYGRNQTDPQFNVIQQQMEGENSNDLGASS